MSWGAACTTLTASLVSLHAAQSPLLDGSLEAKKSKWCATLLESLTSFLLSVYVPQPLLMSLLIASASDLRLTPAVSAACHAHLFVVSSFFCPAFLTAPLFLRSLFFLATADHWEHSPD